MPLPPLYSLIYLFYGLKQRTHVKKKIEKRKMLKVQVVS